MSGHEFLKLIIGSPPAYRGDDDSLTVPYVNFKTVSLDCCLSEDSVSRSYWDMRGHRGRQGRQAYRRMSKAGILPAPGFSAESGGDVARKGV